MGAIHVRWRHPVELPDDPNYHFMTDMTDKTVAWIRYQKALTPDKPFFVYFAPGATHAPHHVPKEWIARRKGRFDLGWDKMREDTLSRQIKLRRGTQGNVARSQARRLSRTGTTSRQTRNACSPARQKCSRASSRWTDHEIGRVVDAIEATGQLDNMLIVFVYGDNGTSAEGGRNGMFSEMTYFNGVQETVADMLKVVDKWGGPETYPHMSAGWAVKNVRYPLPMDQAGRVRPRRNPRSAQPFLAPTNQGQG